MLSRNVIGATALAVLLAATLVACAAGPGPATTGGSSPTASRTVDPGLSEWGGGAVEAAGFVTWVEIEGGFWALEDRATQPPASVQPKIVAVILPGAVTERSISALSGAYVVVTGRIQGGASIRMSGPEVIVDTIALARPGTAR